jgi:MoaA/NifB/PqqE/SkfB family radical SAM enzyme
MKNLQEKITRKKPGSRISRMRMYWKMAKAAVDTKRPVLAQMVVTRRCNLSCGYCYEYDKVSKPVPFDVLKSRIDDFKRLKVVFVTLNGGEPLLHPQIVDLVRYIRDRGMIPMMNSNARVLTPALIKGLNEAGLYGMQISCDSLEDNEVTHKSMRRLKPKLQLLKQHSNFIVRVNGVLGSGPPSEVIEVGKTVLSFGFDFQCSLIRDSKGRVIPLNEEAKAAYMEIRAMRGRLPAALNDKFQLPLVAGNEVKWKCRAGARHFEVDGQGLVHLCQPKTGQPAKPLENYTKQDIRHHFYEGKSCSKKCPIAYAHLGSRMDFFRRQRKPANA